MTEKGLPHARASVLNLIVTVADDAAADRIVRTLLDLGVRHPSRAIVLVPQPGPGSRPLDARISTHCHDMPADGERMCYEEVILTVRGEAADHLSGIVAAAPHPRPADPRVVAGRPAVQRSGLRPARRDGRSGPLRLLRLRRPARRAAAVGKPATRQRRRRPGLGAPGLVAGADRAVLRRAALPALPAEPQPSPDQLCRPARRCRRAPRRPERLGARSLVTDGPGPPLRRLDRDATRLAAVPDAASPFADGGVPADPRGAARDGRPRHSPAADGRRARRRAHVGPAPLAGRDGRRRVHHRPHRRRRGRRHQRRWHDRLPAAGRDGDAARGRAAERPAHRRRRRPGLRGRAARGRDPPRVGARDARVDRPRRPRQRRRGGSRGREPVHRDRRGRHRAPGHRAGGAVGGQHAEAGLPAPPRAGATRRGRLVGGRVLLGRRARGPAGPPGVELRRRLLHADQPAPERPARSGPPHAGRGARPRRGGARLRDRAPARVRRPRRRATRLRPHLARDGRGRPHRQPLPGLAGPRRDGALGRAELGAGARGRGG